MFWSESTPYISCCIGTVKALVRMLIHTNAISTKILCLAQVYNKIFDAVITITNSKK